MSGLGLIRVSINLSKTDISAAVVGASVSVMRDHGSIPDRVIPNTLTMVITVFFLGAQGAG